MKYPKMILFDYGHTLLYEPGWDSARGSAKLLKYAAKNPNHCTLEDVRKGSELIFGKHIENIRKIGYDISGQVGNKVLYEYLGIELEIPFENYMKIDNTNLAPDVVAQMIKNKFDF